VTGRRKAVRITVFRIMDTTRLSESSNLWTNLLGNHEEEDTAENWNSDEIEDTIEDHLSRDRDLVTTLRQTPGDWIESPSENEEASEEGISLLGADETRLLHSPSQEEVGEDEVGEETESIISPLVACRDKSTAQPRDDPDFLQSDHEEDCSPGDTTEEKNSSEDQWPGGNVVNISDVEDGTSLIAEVAIVQRGSDWCVTKVRGHCEVGDEGDEGSNRPEIMEDSLLAEARGRRTS